MSAGYNEPTVCSDLSVLAPQFKAGVEAALKECNEKGYDVIVFETQRSDALAHLYYERGRTTKPPEKPVTNAPTAEKTWHHYGLAVDVISKSDGWNKPYKWWRDVADIFNKHNCKSGIDWKMADLPHHQWYKCKPSPSQIAINLLKEGGVEAVWKAVGAE